MAFFFQKSRRFKITGSCVGGNLPLQVSAASQQGVSPKMKVWPGATHFGSAPKTPIKKSTKQPAKVNFS